MTVVTDVVIVGAGIIGSSAAFHLAKLGKRVIVLEKSSIASGMTKRSGALVRAFLPHAGLARLARNSIGVYQDWKRIVGGECGYNQTGLIVTARDDADAAELRANVERVIAAGVNVRVVASADLGAIEPHAQTTDLALTAYEADAGFIDPVVATHALAARAKELGAKFQTGNLARKIRVERNRVMAVETNSGEVQTTEVIVAAGSWSEKLLKPLGLEIGMQSVRHQVAFFDRPEELRSGHAAFWDVASGAYFRPHTYGLTMGGLIGEKSKPGSPDELDESVSEEFVGTVRDKIATRMSAMAEAKFLRGHAGYFDSTPDGLPVLGRVPGFYGLIVATGFGNAGLCVAPAVGACLAELIYDGETRTADLSAFGLARFKEKQTS